MLMATVSFRIAAGKYLPAMKYLGDVTKHIGSVTGQTYQILARQGGPVGQVVITTVFTDAAAWDAARQKTAADATFQKMVADSAAAGHFVEGSVEQGLWAIVS